MPDIGVSPDQLLYKLYRSSSGLTPILTPISGPDIRKRGREERVLYIIENAGCGVFQSNSTGTVKYEELNFRIPDFSSFIQHYAELTLYP